MSWGIGDAFDGAMETDFAVGKVVRANEVLLVPVLSLDASLLAAGREHRAVPDGAAGAAQLELLGVWIAGDTMLRGESTALPRDADVAPPWLPACSEPPDGASSWSGWLGARPELLARIGRALAAVGAPDDRESS